MPPFVAGNAVVVGIADYQHISGLPRIVLEDAIAIRSVLADQQSCGYNPARITLLLNEQATKCALRHALEEVATRCDPDSTFLFYVSSHGCRIEDGDQRGEYLLPVDAEYDNSASLARTSL